MRSVALPFKVKAIYEYQSGYEDDLSFSPGQIITVNEIEDEEWYSGTYDGQSGMFPKNFVEVVKEEEEGGHSESSKPSGPTAKDTTPAEKPESVEEDKPQQPAKAVASAIGGDSVASGVHDKEEEVKKPEESKPETVAPESFKEPTGEQVGKAGSIQNEATSEGTKDINKKAAAKPPMPYLSQKKVEDPYAIKRQFLAAGKSSYVPPIKPRDTSRVVHPKGESTQPATEIVSEASHKPHEEEETPKVSLQQRIALLQKQQQEEAEREEAALKKREERKKMMQEREKQKKTREIENQKTGESNISRQSTGDVASISSHASHTSVVHPEHTEDAEEGHQQGDRKVSGEMGKIQESEENETNEVKEEEEVEEEEEDDEELKRKKLVERMAKISGGRNMFGMLGIPTPLASGATKGPEDPKTEKVSKEDHEPQQTSRPIPVMPFADPSKLPKSLSKEDDSDYASAVEDTNDETDHAHIDAAIPSDSSSMVEEDDPSESDSRAIQNSENVVTSPKPVPQKSFLSPQSRSESTFNDAGERKNINLEKHVSENETTGYDADEDLSDIARANTITAPHDRDPDSPRAEKVIQPEVPGSFESAGESKKLPSHLPPVPPIPSTRPAPPIPSSAPPIPNDEYREEDKTFVVDDDLDFNMSRQSGTSLPPKIPSEVTDESPLQPPPAVPNVPIPISDFTREEHHSGIHNYESSDEEVSATKATDYDLPNSLSMTKTFPLPPVPSTSSHPMGTHRRTSTELSFKQGHLPRSSTEKSLDNKRQSFDSNLERSKSQRGKSSDKTQAEQSLDIVAYELANISGSSNWWLKSELPDSLIEKVGSDLVFEVDSHSINKRSSRTINYRDYYILFYDLSQLVFELEYESEDPRSTIKLINNFSKPIPIIRKDLLDKYHVEFSSQIVDTAEKLLNSKIASNIASAILSRMKKIVPPVGNKSFGVTIYKNINNSSIAKIDEIRSGDILWIKSAKYVNHKGLMGTAKTVSIGDGNNSYASIVYEYDSKKEKIKVFETDASGLVRKESYKLSDFKSGRLRVFRVVGRDYIDW